MFLKRFADAKPYEAPNHRGVVGLRLQGFEPGGPTINGSVIRNFFLVAALGPIRRHSRRSTWSLAVT